MKDVLRTALSANVPILVWGPPGVGKTAAIRGLAREMGLPIEIVIASIREPTDIAGLPIVGKNGVALAPPAWAVRLYDAGKGILFFDEISTAPPAVQAALLTVILDRRIGDITLPESVHIIAAANPPELAAGGWDLSPPLANRFLHIQWKCDPLDFVDNFPTYWGNPPRLAGIVEDQWLRARAMIAAFIKFRPALLLQVPTDMDRAGKAWPSPRSWDIASRLIASVTQISGNPADAIEYVAGSVGDGAAMEFVTWVKELDLPDPEELLKNPSKFRVPDRGDKVYAILSAVVASALSRLTESRWKAAWKILGTAAQSGAADIAAAAARNLAKVEKADWPLPPEVDRFLKVLSDAGIIKKR